MPIIISDCRNIKHLPPLRGKELEFAKKEHSGLSFERSTRRRRDPEYFKIFFIGKWVGEIWADPKGPVLWTNTVSLRDKKEAEILPKGITKRTPDVLYLKESSSDKGFHYTMLISDYDLIPNVVRHIIGVIKGEII